MQGSGPGNPFTPRRPMYSKRRAQAQRRGFLAFLGILVVLIVVAWVARPGARTDHVQAQTAGHSGKHGAKTGGTASSGESLPADSPIKHVVFMVKENRTFNNYFGTYPGATGSAYGNSIRHGDHIKLTTCADQQAHDITHGFSSGLYSIDGGKMDGYDIIGDGRDLSGYSTCHREQIPNYWAYADRFVLSDHFFTSMFGPTYPEHLYTVAAQSNGIMDNKSTTDHPGNYCDDPTEYSPHFPIKNLSSETLGKIMDLENHITDQIPDNLIRILQYTQPIRNCFDIKVLPDELENAGITWKYYNEPDHWMNALQAIKHVRYGPMWSHVVAPERFVTDVQHGKLPQVSWLIPPESYNEHPGEHTISICAGENWTVQQVNALMHSEYWKNTLLVIVWDDFGGFYDPVVPPHYDIMGLGPRTPALIISPYTKQGDNPKGGYIDRTVYEFSSVLRFIEELFHVPAMTERDKQANPLLGALDFDHPNFQKLVLPYRKDCPYGTTLTPT